MAHQIKFYQDTYRPKTVEGNETAVDPVEFDLSAVSSSSLVFIKGLLYGSAVLTFNNTPTGRELESAADGLRTAGPAFIEGVDAIRGLTVPDALARRLGLRKADEKATAPVEVVNGSQFARVAPYMPELAMEIGFHLSTMSDERGAGADTRLFDSRTTSPDQPAAPSGTVRGARKTSGRAGTADLKRRTVQ